ncbi:uncharacterized protein LOC141622172 [Silene latifolia]|uniref:uncharacterized protein LOC141622172 n=1 Tax=Silene latifolia TaxID=37657 RepID=UPI003D77CACC
MVNLYLICSLLMAALFIISTSAQFDDPDWYFWIPLYAGAAYVNLMNLIGTSSSKITTNVGSIILASGEFLASKVILEHYSGESVSVGILSMNMKERVVREKIGSVLVILCMILQVSAGTEFNKDPAKKMRLDVASSTKYGMAILVCIGYGLSAVFLMYHENEIKF